jgi:hypothetical protein
MNYPHTMQKQAYSQHAPQAMGAARNQPEKKIRSGAISATIWQNEQETPTGKVAYKTVSFERTYKDKAGQWQNTNKLRANDIPRAVLVLNKAYEHLALGEEASAEQY